MPIPARIIEETIWDFKVEKREQSCVFPFEVSF